MAKRFKTQTIEAIKSDANLFAIVAKAIEIKPTTLASNIDRNGNSLNQYHVVRAVADYLKKDPEDLLEQETIGALK